MKNKEIEFNFFFQGAVIAYLPSLSYIYFSKLNIMYVM